MWLLKKMLRVFSFSPVTTALVLWEQEGCREPGERCGQGRAWEQPGLLVAASIILPRTLFEAWRKRNCWAVHRAVGWWERRAINRKNYQLPCQLAQLLQWGPGACRAAACLQGRRLMVQGLSPTMSMSGWQPQRPSLTTLWKRGDFEAHTTVERIAVILSALAWLALVKFQPVFALFENFTLVLFWLCLNTAALHAVASGPVSALTNGWCHVGAFNCSDTTQCGIWLTTSLWVTVTVQQWWAESGGDISGSSGRRYLCNFRKLPRWQWYIPSGDAFFHLSLTII